jgi:hypothetical protein
MKSLASCRIWNKCFRGCRPTAMVYDLSMDHDLDSKQTGTGSTKTRKSSGRSAVSTSSPLGLLALYLLGQWSKSPRGGIVFLAEDENRAERIGSLLHSLDPLLGVLLVSTAEAIMERLPMPTTWRRHRRALTG